LPEREDKVDQALANFINNYPEKQKIKILFLRQSEGVYRFGQKQVQIKVLKGNKVYIKVGGGYMLADEFITKYTEPEIDKINRRDVIKRFNQKINIQRISSRLSSSSVERIPLHQ